MVIIFNVLIDFVAKGKEKWLQLFCRIVNTGKSQQHCVFDVALRLLVKVRMKEFALNRS